MSVLPAAPFGAKFLDYGGAVYNVKHPSLGAVGDGSDESAIIQAAVNLAGVNGGCVYMPGNDGEVYGVASTIDVRSTKPVHFVGDLRVCHYNTYAGSWIQPLAALPNGIIRYQTPSGSSRGLAGGGSIRNLAFIDSNERSLLVNGALNLIDFDLSFIRDCLFSMIKGQAIICDRAVQSGMDNCHILYCGSDADGAPAVVLGLDDTDATNIVQSFNVNNCRLEVCYGTYIYIEDKQATIGIDKSNFESDGTANSWYKYILSKGDKIRVTNCNFNRNEGATHVDFDAAGGQSLLADCTFDGDHTSADPTIIIASQRNNLDNHNLHGATSQTGTQISITGTINTMSNILVSRGGNIDISGSIFLGSNIHIYDLDTTESAAIKVPEASLVTGLYVHTTNSGTVAAEYAGQAMIEGRYLNTDGAVDGVVRRFVKDFVRTLANDATPSVLGVELCKSGGTTTITDFDDGVVGQTITFLAAHSITITDNANIILNGSGNFVMAATDTLTLTMFASGVWSEVARSDNS